MSDNKWMNDTPIDDLEYPMMPREPEPFDAAEPTKPVTVEKTLIHSQMKLLHGLNNHSLPTYVESILGWSAKYDLTALIDAGLVQRHGDYFVITPAGIAAVGAAIKAEGGEQ